MRVGYLTTSTSGLSALIARSAESTFGVADAVGGVDDLALQVGEVDDVVVDDPERADARGGEVERGRRAEAARAEQQHLRVEQLLLALEADLRDEQVARVALALLGGERARDLDLVAAVLPQRDAAGHRLDVLVAEQLLQRVGGERGAVAGRAVEDHALRAVGRPRPRCATPGSRAARAWRPGCGLPRTRRTRARRRARRRRCR